MHRTGMPLLARVSLALCLAFLNSAARADIVHLKSGGSITADAWEIRGDTLIIHQGDGRLAVPRSEVVRIEATPRASPTPGSAAARSAPAGPAPREPVAPAQPVEIAQMTEDQILRAIDDLKRRLSSDPAARAENARRLVALLDQLGATALNGRNYDAALGRFREALAYDPRDLRAQLGLAIAYIRAGQDVSARSTLEGAILDHPDAPVLHVLLGDVYYGQEKTAEALAEWQKAYQMRPDDDLKAKIDKLVRERSVDGSYRQSEAAHFTLKYDGERGGADLGGQILEFLESRFRDLETRFNHYPTQPIVVILYPQRQFYDATQLDANVGGLYDGKIRVPIGGLQQINSGARSVLLHELAHAFIAGKSHDTAPRWLHEGLAQDIEGKDTPTATGIALAKEFRALQIKDAWGEAFSYPSALSFVEYLEDRLGFPVLVDVLDAMGRGASAEQAFQQLTRDPLMELRKAWGEALVRKYLQ